jgi:hypothetical protein
MKCHEMKCHEMKCHEMKSHTINGTSKKFSLKKSHLGVIEVRDKQKI